MLTALAGLSLAVWLYLLLLHGRYWRADQRLDDLTPAATPSVVVVVPARNEADVVATALTSLLHQDYAGIQVILVDDGSDDGTGDMARALDDPRLTVLTAPPRPPGWVGKMWAVETGVAAAAELAPDASYVLLTDADIAHDPGTVRCLVAKAERDDLALASLMVRLHCRGPWERLLIPAFVYFFQQLYPFPWVNDPRRRTAGAAGGCMLVRRTALETAGGIAAVKGALIDDCALARVLKRQGPVWLGLGTRERSLRAYRGPAPIWRMIARSAYAQLQFSPMLLALCVVGMALVYVVPPGLALTWPSREAGALAAAAWAVMAITYVPTLRLYGQRPVSALLLPLAGLFYTLATLDSARRHWLGRGGEWKGRVRAGA